MDTQTVTLLVVPAKKTGRRETKAFHYKQPPQHVLHGLLNTEVEKMGIIGRPRCSGNRGNVQRVSQFDRRRKKIYCYILIKCQKSTRRQTGINWAPAKRQKWSLLHWRVIAKHSSTVAGIGTGRHRRYMAWAHGERFSELAIATVLTSL